ncbi:aldo/keto reductase [Anaerovibrio sp.]|uniref:aldo/keto reductase n=1 Tax=Anaerovibrio sp. TaxID=1872532 RepID=UPI003F173AFF
MEKRYLGTGKNALEVSAIGLGCMGFSHGYGKPMNEQETIRIIRKAFELGYTFFDTAEIYGTPDNPFANEELVGKALKSCRQQVVIATKFGIRFDTSGGQVPYPLITNSSPQQIRQSVEGSLKRLQTDYIDLYFQHRIDAKVPAEEVAGVMADLIKEGKIRSWGISEASEEYLRRAHAVCPVTAVENRYSMMARGHEALFPVLEELGIGMVAFSPMANGLLTGKYDSSYQFDARHDYRSHMPQFTAQSHAENQELFSLLERMAQAKNATWGQISMAWMLGRKKWLVPIPGTRKENRLKENAGAADIHLSEKEIQKLDTALNSMKMSAVFGGTPVKK